MKHCINYIFLVGCLLAQSACKPIESEHASSLSPSMEVIRQIIRSQFCTLAKLRGVDNRIFAGETDSSRYDFILGNNFTSLKDRDTTVNNINKFMLKEKFNTIHIDKVDLFTAEPILLSSSTKFSICNEYHKVIIHASNDTSAINNSDVLVVSKPVNVNDTLRLYYYEFGKPKGAMSAGFSIFNVHNSKIPQPLYEATLWILQ